MKIDSTLDITYNKINLQRGDCRKLFVVINTNAPFSFVACF